MRKADYVSHPEIDGFINWMANEVVSRRFRLNISKSRFVPNRIVENVQGVEGLLGAYCWRSSWTHPDTNHSITMQGWDSTRQGLERLSEGLRQAMHANDEQATLLWTESVLRWGGVSGALSFLRRRAEQGTLVQYLKSVEPLLRLDDDVDDEGLSADTIQKFDAGMTKIHSLIDQTGSPIYDSRVGAAISMFVAIYNGDNRIRPDLLRFPAGDARGTQIRNPGELGFLAAPKFYTRAVSCESWARSQLRLGWILQAVLERSGVLSDIGSQHERMQAFQATLFVAGYDLRCFNTPEIEVNAGQNAEKSVSKISESTEIGGEVNGDERMRFRSMVPTGITMEKVVELFSNYRLSLRNDEPSTRIGFVRWQVAHGVNRNTANSNCSPLMDSEFFIYDRNVADLQCFSQGGYEALQQIVPQAQFNPDEREFVYLTCVYLAGVTMNEFCAPAQRIEWLIATGFAGTVNSAGTIMSAGRSVGRYFNLIDPERRPTPNFHEYFRDDSWRDLNP